jgi:hypothetical protein
MLISNFLNLHNQIKIYHWQTTSYAEHQALGGAYDKLGELIDGFVEVYMGKYGRRFATEGFNFSLHNYSKEDVNEFLDQYDQYLSTELEIELEEMDTELKNIRDEMKAVLNHTKYLLTLA